MGKVLDAIKEFEAHPSILKIKEYVTVDVEFSFVEVSLRDSQQGIKSFKCKKSVPLHEYSAKKIERCYWCY